MKVFMLALDLRGQPVPGEGDAYSGRTPLDIVRAMRESAIFRRDLSDNEFMRAAASDAKGMHGVDIDISGDTPAERAQSFLDSVVELGWAEVITAGSATVTTLPRADRKR